MKRQYGNVDSMKAAVDSGPQGDILTKLHFSSCDSNMSYSLSCMKEKTTPIISLLISDMRNNESALRGVCLIFRSITIVVLYRPLGVLACIPASPPTLLYFTVSAA